MPAAPGWSPIVWLRRLAALQLVVGLSVGWSVIAMAQDAPPVPVDPVTAWLLAHAGPWAVAVVLAWRGMALVGRAIEAADRATAVADRAVSEVAAMRGQMASGTLTVRVHHEHDGLDTLRVTLVPPVPQG